MAHDTKRWWIKLALIFIATACIKFVFHLPLAAAVAVSVLCVSLFLGGTRRPEPPRFHPKRSLSMNLDDPV
jgi:hypothetical protein